MTDSRDIDDLELRLGGLQTSIASTTQVTSAFQAGLDGMRSSLSETDRYMKGMSSSFRSELSSAFGEVIFEGGKLSDSLKSLAKSMMNTAFEKSITPVTNGLADVVMGSLGSVFSGAFGFEKGGAFSSGRVMPFAKGGVVTQPTTFPMRGGATGLMGEAGAEAIMPLARSSDGSLGVRTHGGANVTVNMNISTPDVQGFARSRSQIAAGLSRAIQRGKKNF